MLIYERAQAIQASLAAEAATSLLEPDADKTSGTVRSEMIVLLEWMKQTYTKSDDAPMMDNILRYTKEFWNGLFICYDKYHLPSTNNDLAEIFDVSTDDLLGNSDVKSFSLLRPYPFISLSGIIVYKQRSKKIAEANDLATYFDKGVALHVNGTQTPSSYGKRLREFLSENNISTKKLVIDFNVLSEVVPRKPH